MKRWVTAAVAVLLVWNVALTAALLGQADQRTDNGGITVVNHTINGYTTDVTGILRDVRPSLVTVRITEDEFEDTFSGAVYEVRDDGCYILTTASLLRESAVCSIRFDSGVELSGEIVGRDLLTDIGLEAPAAMQFTKILEEKGVSLPGSVMTMDEMAETILHLLRK